MDSPFAILGAGRVGTAFALALTRRGAGPAAVASRELSRAQAVSSLTGVLAVPIEQLPSRASRILIAVSDDAIPAAAELLCSAGLDRGAVLHTSGCVGIEALAALAERGVSTGALHPLQTFPTPEIGAAQLPGSTFAVGGDGEAGAWAREIAALLDGRVLAIRAEHWSLYHAAAVIASNYHATILDAALECLEAAGVRREDGLAALTPLLEGTLRSILRLGPQQALTGPISRGDVRSVRRNRASLGAVSEPTRELYDTLARRTIEIMKRRGITPETNQEWKQIFYESNEAFARAGSGGKETAR